MTGWGHRNHLVTELTADVVHVHLSGELSCYSAPKKFSFLPYLPAARFELSELAALDDASKEARYWGIPMPCFPTSALDSETGHSGGDMTEPSGQRSGERATSTKRRDDHGDDTSRDDHVLERHHAVLVRA